MLRTLIVACLGWCVCASALAADRIISIDGSLTEIIYELGAEAELVAVDTTSLYPESAQALPNVGYMRQLSVEGILALQPTLVFASTDAGPENVFTQLEHAGVRIVRIQNEYSLNGVFNKISHVARALNKEAEGKQLQQRIEERAEQALSRIPQGATAPSTLFLLGAGTRGIMAAGKGTQANAMLGLVAARNVMDYSGYKPASPEALVKANPEVVVIAHTEAAGKLELNSHLEMTQAARDQRVHVVETSVVLGFGPRIAQAIETLVNLLYPTEVMAAAQ